jgi:diguanylate cyclase (GGDEF)-like protein/PAS domain S-box-containing protein
MNLATDAKRANVRNELLPRAQRVKTTQIRSSPLCDAANVARLWSTLGAPHFDSRPMASEHIILVERSSTLSHLVQRTLGAANTLIEKQITSYADAVEYLESNAVGVMVLGAPQRTNAEFESLLSYLKQGAGADVPVLLMANEKTPQLTQWLSDRRFSQTLLWSNFGRIPAALSQLLPATAAPADATEGAQPIAPVAPRARALNLLFIDDSQSVRFAYKQMLQGQGFEVDVAASIAEGNAKAQSGTFDLIVVDYYLPDGTGDQLVTRLKADPRTANIPIAMITGTYKDSIIKKCLDAGAVECMFKNEVLDLSLARIKALARTIDVQRRIETERLRLDGILGSVGDGVYGVDDDGIVTFANPAAVELLGYVHEQDLIGKRAHLSFHFAAEDGSNLSELDSQISKAYASGGQLKGYETVFWTKSSEPLPVEASVVPLSIQNRRQGSVVVFRNISERKSAERLRWELNHDALTGLANKRQLSQALTQEIDMRRERGGYSAVLYMDLDRFALAEEHLGDVDAQKLLVDVGGKLKDRLRDGDVVSRLQDDHFALLLTGVQLENLFTIADGFRELIHQCNYLRAGTRVQLTGTVGVAIISKDTPSAEYALEHARVACTLGKRRGSDQTQIYVSDADARIARELDAGWSIRIRDALHEQRFVLLCQPIMGMIGMQSEADLRKVGGFSVNPKDFGEQIYELLIRMVNRDGQWVSPSVFVPLAERVGLMNKIDLWVLSQAIKTLRSTSGRLSFTVNLSNVTLQDPESIKMIEDQLRANPDVGGRLIFEVTETREIGSLHSARRAIQTLRKLGVRFALDDFGTGFSSISHLKHLPVDFVKIEGSFIAGLSDSDTDQTMVHSITSLAHALSLKVIAEHVATGNSLSWLKNCGVDYSQGHLLGEPTLMSDVDWQALVP